MLACNDLTFAYSPRVPVLRGVSLSVSPGRVAALVGPNGCGKSTLLRLLAGLAGPSTGSVTLDGRPCRAWSPAERARRLALLAQRPEVAFGYTVRDVVAFGRVSTGSSEARPIDGALARVGLTDRAAERFEHLSVGQQQRAALARALAQLSTGEHAALLADEPVSAMDPKHAIESLSIMRGLAQQGHAVLIVLHDLNHALRFADDAVLLDEQGTVAASGEAREVLTPATLEPVFGVGFESVSRDGGPPLLLPTEPIGPT